MKTDFALRVSAFGLLLAAAAALAGCPGAPVTPDPQNDPHAQDQSRIHFDLGVTAQSSGDVRSALHEFETALSYDPKNAEAENALGLLYHLSFRQLDESEKHYRTALQLKPDFSAAKVNLAALFLDQSRYDEAIALDEEVLKDLQYKSAYLPANNEGWAYFKKGDPTRGLALIQEAVRTNPDFCQGYRNLGLIHESLNQLDLATEELTRMVKKCPDSAQGWYDLARVQLRQNNQDAARQSFGRCRDLAKEGDPLLDSCTKLAGEAR